MSLTVPFLPRIGADEPPLRGGVRVRSMTNLPLTAQQRSMLSHAFELHKLNVRASRAQYLVKNGKLDDGTQYRIESNGPDHAIYAWPKADGGKVLIPRVYSGVVRTGKIVNVSGKLMLRDFRPTQQCWEYPLARSTSVPTGEYSDIKQLAIGPFGASEVGSSKFAYTQASMYSGLMAKLVQVILGYGKEDTLVGLTTHVAYNWMWDNCHGIAKGPDGVAWLLWISSFHGLLAMPLPIMQGTAGLVTSPQDVLREAATLFGGLPTGQGFPSDINAAIAAGKVLRLLTAGAMSDYFNKTPFSTDLGWSFNANGSEAHNVVYGTVGDPYPPDFSYSLYRPRYTSFHYKLAITIGALVSNPLPGQPIADCSAALTIVEQAEMRQRIQPNPVEKCIVLFYQPELIGMRHPPAVPSTVAESGVGGLFDGDYPVLACHIDGELDVMRVQCDADRVNTVVSDRFPDPGHGALTSLGVQYGFWPRGQRDGYIMVSPPDENEINTWSVVTERGDVIETEIAWGDQVHWFAQNAVLYEDFLLGEWAVNVSVLGPTLHAAYSADFYFKSAEPVAEATGTLLDGQPVAGPPPNPGQPYRWNTYAFAGYI